MPSNTRLGLGILGGAILLGIVADQLLVVSPWGVNVALVVALIAIAVFTLTKLYRVELGGEGRYLFFPAIAFAALFVWRDSTMLFIANFLTLLMLFALIGFRTRAGQLRIAGLFEYAVGGVIGALEAGLGAFVLLFHTINWKEISANGSSRVWLALGRGALIALPLVCIFGALFVAADAAFEGLLKKYLNIQSILTHGFWIAVLTWIALGFLRQTLLASRWESLNVKLRPFVTTGVIEMAVVLGLLNALFLAFVLVQFFYLFGGASLIELTKLSFAEYARRGFFELVTVAALVLPMLLIADWIVRRDHPAQLKIFRGLVGALIALLFVVMISAMRRMGLYMETYGLTELRVYTTAFMGWLALVFGWFLVTVLRERRDQFAFGALIAGLVVVITLNAINPDDLIVQTNVGREMQSVTSRVPFDAPYVTLLSADSVPALVATIPQMKKSDACYIAAQVVRRYSPPANFDWRTWNYSRVQAWDAVGRNSAMLKQIACPTR
jgi:hypothetical protein